MENQIRPASVPDSLTLCEKASLLSGREGWHTKASEHAGLESIVLTDGPHGVRRLRPDSEHFSFHGSLPATCFPTAAALGSSWDPQLLETVGEALGREARAAGVAVLLGPGVNIKRSPLCGRNFEYLSEDPFLTGRLGAALVRGIQSQGVASCVKHFAANNQETERMRVSARVDERTLREIYLAAFEHVITEARPWTVMAAYNRINGVYAAQNHWLLTEVLRDEWGFDGVVVSDWGAVQDTVASVAAGLDLEMPGSGSASETRLVEAVDRGELDEALIDRAVERLAALVRRTTASTEVSDADAVRHHELARRAARESAVLLKNECGLLPLDPDGTTTLAVLGEFARTPRFQGAGSSQVNPTRQDNALDSLRELAGPGVEVTFAPGFRLDGEDAPALAAEAVAAAAAAEVVVLFLGLPEGKESEGFDRTHLALPERQTALLEEVAAVNPNTVVVLSNGAVVEVSGWQRHSRAVLEAWLGGQAGGAAVADLLFGRANPSGRLAESIPVRLADTPAHLNFPGSEGTVTYGERLYVGYRYYDAKDLGVAYPFGHGLSYTTFGYSSLSTEVEGRGDDVVVRLRLTVTNTGDRPGREVVQVYVGDAESSVDRPPRELKGFVKTGELTPGQSVPVTLELRSRDLSFYSVARHAWVLEPGEFTIEVGASSRDIRLGATIVVEAPSVVPPLSQDSSVAEWLSHPVGGPVLKQALEAQEGSDLVNEPEILRMVESLPLVRLVAMSGGRLDLGDMDELIERIGVGSA
ncbi:glycoside hydrolase family 3 C-terminal domain-containing protein [Streptomyces sp. NPDC002643]